MCRLHTQFSFQTTLRTPLPFHKTCFKGGCGGDYGELKESWIGKRGFIRYWDEQAKVPYLFDGETFISYEDCESLGVKIAYLKEKGMGGIMFWEYKCDPSGELLSFIKKNM